MLARPGAAHELQEDRLHRGEGGYAAASPSIEREPPNLNAGECTNGHYGSSTFSGQSVLADGVATMPPLLILSGGEEPLQPSPPLQSVTNPLAASTEGSALHSTIVLQHFTGTSSLEGTLRSTSRASPAVPGMVATVRDVVRRRSLVKPEEPAGDDYLQQVSESGAVDKYAGWHKASHPIQRLQRLLDLFALHSTTLHTSLYSRLVLWVMAVRAALVMAYLGLHPTSSISSGNQYTSIGIIVMLWLMLCLLVQATFLYHFRTDSLTALYATLCSDDSYPDLEHLLRDSLARSLRRILPIAIGVIAGNTVFLIMVNGGILSYYFPASSDLTAYFQALTTYPLHPSPTLAAGLVCVNAFASGHWIFGVVICYWATMLITLRFNYLIERVKAGSLSLTEIRLAHTKACELIEVVDRAMQLVSTAWTVVGWALMIFLLSVVLLAQVGMVMWSAAIFWLVAGFCLQGALAVSAAVMQASHDKLTETLIASNQGLDQKLELFALLTRLQNIQPGMTAVFGALRMDWRFLITVSSTVSSAFVLLNQIQKYGARGATGAITS